MLQFLKAVAPMIPRTLLVVCICLTCYELSWRLSWWQVRRWVRRCLGRPLRQGLERRPGDPVPPPQEHGEVREIPWWYAREYTGPAWVEEEA